MISYKLEGSVMTLDAETTMAWEDKGSLGERTRWEILRDARTLAPLVPGEAIRIVSHSGETLEERVTVQIGTR